MCISMNAGAIFSGVITAGFQLSRDIHALAYMNKATTMYGPNCMLLHVPGDIYDLVRTHGAGDFMTNMGYAVHDIMPALTLGGTFRGGGMRSVGFTVEKYGAYEVVLAKSASVIPQALQHVSPIKRPTVNADLLDWYGANYPDCSFVLACFNNQQEVADHPIFLRYMPHDTSMLYAPGLESHTGEPPALGAHENVRGFKVVFGSKLADGSESGVTWNHRNHSYGHQLDALLPERIVGFHDIMYGANEDYVAKVDDVLNGVTWRELFKTMPAHYEGSIVQNFEANSPT